MTPDLKLYRGDTDLLEVAVTSHGDPLDLSGGDLRFTAKRRIDDGDADAVIVKTTLDGGITVTDAQEGLATIEILAADTEDLTSDATLYCDLQLTVGLDVKTVWQGTLRVTRDVSRTAP